VVDVIRTIAWGNPDERRAAVAELAQLASEAAPEATRLGTAIGIRGNPGEWGVNDWLRSMLGLYKELTGQEPRTSIGAPTRGNEGDASGPLIRFVTAAGSPVGLTYTPQAWRGRIRAILARRSIQN
jgi:hypothetical protein